jgi:hypothetical protein
MSGDGEHPNAWPMLGAVAQATDQLELMTYCPVCSKPVHRLGGRSATAIGSAESKKRAYATMLRYQAVLG